MSVRWVDGPAPQVPGLPQADYRQWLAERGAAPAIAPAALAAQATAAALEDGPSPELELTSRAREVTS